MFFLGNLSCKTQSIIFEHISTISDKPIYTLTITNKRSTTVSLKERLIVVSRKEFEIIYEYVIKNATKVRFEIKEYPFGSFKIAFNNRNYVLEESNLSKDYFNKLIELLDFHKMQKISKEIRILSSRI